MFFPLFFILFHRLIYVSSTDINNNTLGDNNIIEALVINRNQELLYFESLINIESFIFLIEINSLSNYGIDSLIELMVYPVQVCLISVLESYRNGKGIHLSGGTYKNPRTGDKSSSLWSVNAHNEAPNSPPPNPTDKLDLITTHNADSVRTALSSIIINLTNFTQHINTNNAQLSRSLEVRNSMFKNDKSQISKLLYLNNLKAIKSIINNTPDSDLYNLLNIENLPIKRLKYKQMFFEFHKALLQTNNIRKIINIEKTNFLNLFLYSSSIDKTEYNKIRIIINLGGSFLLPSLLYNLNEKVLYNNNTDLLNKTILKIIKPVETLKLQIRHKTPNEKKFLILKFLNETLSNNIMYSEAFESRSNLLNLYFNNDISKVYKIDLYQDIMIRKYTKWLETIDSEYFDKFLLVNKEIVDLYCEYLGERKADVFEKIRSFFS
ncbi:hypothetical protein CDIK_0552 [Cucumispora dikerogammari]|nr:hypothetical protein CDIK_0552 [Cucumispora dikerogammari]